MLSATSLLLLGLTALSTALPLPPAKRDVITAQTIIGDIKGIDTGVNALTAALTTYDGSPLAETPILVDITAIHVANRKGYADINLRETPFNTTDSRVIVDYTILSVGVDIPHSVEVLKSKKPLLDATVDQDPLIVSGLELLLNDHDTFSAVLLAKTTGSDNQAAGNAVVAKIHNSIQSGIDYFSS